jgi:DEAD/DEAH box helicase domain-containing protein
MGRTIGVLSAGTSAGKSLAYLLPALTKACRAEDRTRTKVLYIAPTKALAADQWRAVRALDLERDGVRAATLDGDTTIEGRDWIKSHATYVLTNPDMLHRTVLPGHPRWSRLFRSLSYVVMVPHLPRCLRLACAQVVMPAAPDRCAPRRVSGLRARVATVSSLRCRR